MSGRYFQCGKTCKGKKRRIGERKKERRKEEGKGQDPRWKHAANIRDALTSSIRRFFKQRKAFKNLELDPIFRMSLPSPTSLGSALHPTAFHLINGTKKTDLLNSDHQILLRGPNLYVVLPSFLSLTPQHSPITDLLITLERCSSHVSPTPQKTILTGLTSLQAPPRLLDEQCSPSWLSEAPPLTSDNSQQPPSSPTERLAGRDSPHSFKHMKCYHLRGNRKCYHLRGKREVLSPQGKREVLSPQGKKQVLSPHGKKESGKAWFRKREERNMFGCTTLTHTPHTSSTFPPTTDFFLQKGKGNTSSCSTVSPPAMGVALSAAYDKVLTPLLLM